MYFSFVFCGLESKSDKPEKAFFDTALFRVFGEETDIYELLKFFFCVVPKPRNTQLSRSIYDFSHARGTV